jgi:hypothetical protein
MIIESIPIYLLNMQINYNDNSVLENFIKIRKKKNISVFELSIYEDKVI